MNLIRVGEFELRPSERMLCAGGKPVELGARAFDLLLALVENAGTLVSKAALIERVWPRLVVEENNLPVQIASLRRVLGARAIRTVPGYGYRLELQVSVAHDEIAASATPAATLGRDGPQLTPPRRSWPERLAALVDREDDVRGVEEALSRSSLVTIVGIAGVGKTRLAQEILARESQKPNAAVVWVALAAVRQADHLASAIALALGLSLPDGFEAFAALRQALENLPLLLILDCAEHLGAVLATPLAELIAHTRSVRALVTSQTPLGIVGETVYRLAVLAVPEQQMEAAEAAQCPAVKLFVQRARAADQRFQLSSGNLTLVSEICRRLDGIPLALELAAARTPALGLQVLLDRLDERFRLLKVSGTPPDPRHGALHTAFDWSYGLLQPAEQRAFARLGTFAGSFALEAGVRCIADAALDGAEAVDLIVRLAERSLITVLDGEPARYVLLETARHYALERLAADGGAQEAEARMAAAMLFVLDAAYDEYWSLDEAAWLQRYEPELANVRAALDWALAHDAALSVALFGSAWPLLVEMDLYAEGRERYAQVLACLSNDLPRARVGRFWEAITAYDSTRQCDRARYAAELAATMHESTSDTRARYYALMQLASNWRVDTGAARAAFDAARQLEDSSWPARLLTYGALTEGALLMSAGRFIEARSAYQRAVRLALAISERQALAATVGLVELDIACGDTGAALQLGRPLAGSLRHMGRREARFEILALVFNALLIAGQIEEARATASELYELALRLDTGRLYAVLDAMALFACQEGRHEAAARIAVYADAAHAAHGQVRRRPAEAHIRSALTRQLDTHLGPAWRDTHAGRGEPLEELDACSLALGLRA